MGTKQSDLDRFIWTNSDKQAVLDRWICDTYAGREHEAVSMWKKDADPILANAVPECADKITLVGPNYRWDNLDKARNVGMFKSGWAIIFNISTTYSDAVSKKR